MTENEQDTSLNDGSILRWERPLKKGYFSRLHMYNGSTKLIEQIGFDTLDETIGPFKIRGSATKYLADIIHLGKNWFKSGGESVSGDEKREILFSGGLTIYREGQVPGTEFQGYDLERHGRIWTARNPEDRFSCPDGLKNLVLESSSDPVARIESILLGYQTQENNKKRSQEKRSHESWKRGRMEGIERGSHF